MDIKTFIENSKNKIKKFDNYCVIVLATLGPINKEVKFIYKSLEEFTKKIDNDIIKIDNMLDVEFQIWEFD